MLDDLKAANRRWAAGLATRDPGLLERLTAGQSPELLWIGCSDSRVPPEQILGLAPGQVFVHRNVANLAGAHDPSWRAVLQFAVEVLRVRHVLVVGHTGCGGVAAAIAGGTHGPVDAWLAPVRALARSHAAELAAAPEGAARTDRLVALNVRRQVRGVSDDPIVRSAWARGAPLAVHGWMYGLADGLLTDVDVTVASPSDADRTFNSDRD